MSSFNQRLLVVVGIVLLAFNLRPAAVSIGPVLGDLRADLQMSGAEAGLLTALPVLAFAGFGALAPLIARTVGIHRTTLLGLIFEVIGLFGRSRVDSVAPFLLLSLLALIGMATSNVLLPSLVKKHFPTRVGTMTAVYSTSMAVGLTAASVFTVPISDAYGGWRDGLAAWAVMGVVAAIPWLGLILHDSQATGPVSRIGLSQVARTRLGWVMALFFGLQSLMAYTVFGWFADLYQSAGFSDRDAGLLLGVITGMSIPLSFVIPGITARMTNQTVLIAGIVALYPISYLGLIVAPHALGVLWAVVLGAALITFPLILTLIGLRARTPEGTAALSGFTQSVGYLLAATGPFGFGFLHDLTDGWTVPLGALIVITVPLMVFGLLAAKPRFIEDELVGSRSKL